MNIRPIDTLTHGEIAELGRTAAQAGERQDVNPFQPGTTQAIWWETAYLWQQRELAEVDV